MEHIAFIYCSVCVCVCVRRGNIQSFIISEFIHIIRICVKLLCDNVHCQKLCTSILNSADLTMCVIEILLLPVEPLLVDSNIKQVDEVVRLNPSTVTAELLMKGH